MTESEKRITNYWQHFVQKICILERIHAINESIRTHTDVLVLYLCTNI